jgi:hypothetical protein
MWCVTKRVSLFHVDDVSSAHRLAKEVYIKVLEKKGLLAGSKLRKEMLVWL